MISHQGIKLANLAVDIAERGLNPSELPLVANDHYDGTYTVLEGNRRIAALKLATSPALLASISDEALPRKLRERFESLHNRELPLELLCTVVSRDESNHWINLKHTGENNGIGVVNWDGAATARFRGNSPAQQAVRNVEDSPYISQDIRNKLPQIPITNLARILSTPEVRARLGVEIKEGDLIFLGDKDESIARLSIIVSDLVNKVIKVTDLDTKAQRIEYVNQVINAPRPETSQSSTSQIVSKSQASKAPKSPKPLKPSRNVIIPKAFKLRIEQPRINRIYNELQQLDIEKFTNCAAVMLRVFVELSLDHFADKHQVPFPTVKNTKSFIDLHLARKLEYVATFLEEKGICSNHDLKRVRVSYSTEDDILSVRSLHAYVHNMNYSPGPSDLKSIWDSIEVFIGKLWQ
ncbi:MAG TPA: ParB/Srx family N-terminal domain-containing protein [Aggregatilineales bacterium]|nr:ParB/Srx family N-terminal domain-containing protein [Aggregatilineales bacterium]